MCDILDNDRQEDGEMPIKDKRLLQTMDPTF